MRELRASDPIVEDGLASLGAAGLVSRGNDGTFGYTPASTHLDRLVQELARAYREKPLAVTNAIFSSPSDKLQTFANAFRLRKD